MILAKSMQYGVSSNDEKNSAFCLSQLRIISWNYLFPIRYSKTYVVFWISIDHFSNCINMDSHQVLSDWYCSCSQLMVILNFFHGKEVPNLDPQPHSYMIVSYHEFAIFEGDNKFFFHTRCFLLMIIKATYDMNFQFSSNQSSEICELTCLSKMLLLKLIMCFYCTYGKFRATSLCLIVIYAHGNHINRY